MEKIIFVEPFGLKFLDPTGCTYYNNEAFQYNLPQHGEKWSKTTIHPEPAEPDGKACGPGRLHQMKVMRVDYAPINWWPWWSRGIGDQLGQDQEKRGWAGLRLRRISPAVFARALRPPFNWGHGANLRWADLREANLFGADLTDKQREYARKQHANM